jgi:hypothetical protein
LKQLNTFSSELHEGSVLISSFHDSSKTVANGAIDSFANVIRSRRGSLNGLRKLYSEYEDIESALSEVIISAGSGPVPGTLIDSLLRSLDELSRQTGSDEETRAPYLNAVERDIGAVKDWIEKTKKTADSQAAAMVKLR